MFVLLAQFPGEDTISKALDTDPLVLVLVVASMMAIAIVLAALSVFFFVRIVGQRASGEYKTTTTLATALADVLSTRDSQIAQEIKSGNESDQKYKDAQTELMTKQAKALEALLANIAALTDSLVEPLAKITTSVDSLKTGADEDRKMLVNIVNQNTTLDDVVRSLRDEFTKLVTLVKETTGNIADLQRVLTRIDAVDLKVTEINDVVHYLKGKADTQEMHAVQLPPDQPSPTEKN